jgi:hypothetical protein
MAENKPTIRVEIVEDLFSSREAEGRGIASEYQSDAEEQSGGVPTWYAIRTVPNTVP